MVIRILVRAAVPSLECFRLASLIRQIGVNPCLIGMIPGERGMNLRK
jgi:hypothetical protein